MRVFASPLTGVTSVSLVLEDTATQDITASLVAGGWAQIARFVTDMGNSFGTYNRLNSGAYNGSKVVIRVVTTGSFAAGVYLFVDAEMLTASASLYTTSGNPTYTDTSRPLEIAGSGAPSLNAAFVGQKYLNVANGQRYTAKAVGSGAGDWA